MTNIEKLGYSYLYHYNSYSKKYYCIERDSLSGYFNGKEERYIDNKMNFTESEISFEDAARKMSININQDLTPYNIVDAGEKRVFKIEVEIPETDSEYFLKKLIDKFKKSYKITPEKDCKCRECKCDKANVIKFNEPIKVDNGYIGKKSFNKFDNNKDNDELHH